MRPLRTALILLLGAWSLSFVALLAVYSISTARRLEANTLHALERRAKILGESIKDHQAKLRKIAESTELLLSTPIGPL